MGQFSCSECLGETWLMAVDQKGILTAECAYCSKEMFSADPVFFLEPVREEPPKLKVIKGGRE